MGLKCHCYECTKEPDRDLLFFLSIMIICPQCGNKRCPHATDHRLACTNSNKWGQLGSRYGIYPHPSIELIRFINGENPREIDK